MAIKMKPDDPAYWMLFDGVTTTPVVYSADCYICNDSEFAQMGLPLCRKCPVCGGHIPADDSVCDNCGYDEYEAWCIEQTEIDIILDIATRVPWRWFLAGAICGMIFSAVVVGIAVIVVGLEYRE